MRSRPVPHLPRIQTTPRPALALMLSVLLSGPAVGRAAAQDPPAAVPAPAKTTLTLTLPECLRLALEKQPRIAAQQASLAAAEDGRRAAEELRIPECLARELAVRRRQAALGVTAAAAGVDQAQRETVYAVTRTYYTVLFARAQERVATDVVDRLTAVHQVAQDQLKAGARNVTDTDVNRTLVYLRLAETKRVQAAQGVKRARAALREAIGLAPDVSVDVPRERMTEPQAAPQYDEVLAAALSRRAELLRVNIFAEVTCLEAEAQDDNHHLRVQTFAAASDLHSIPVPEGFHNNEYRPGAVGPEMPEILAGRRAERVTHARSLHARAQAVVEATRSLIALEAEDAFLRWEEAEGELAKARQAAETGQKLADDLTRDFTAGLKTRVEDVVNARVLASQAQAQYNEFLYRAILALADLERITAGGFTAGLVEPVLPTAHPTPPGDGAGK